MRNFKDAGVLYTTAWTAERFEPELVFSKRSTVTTVNRGRAASVAKIAIAPAERCQRGMPSSARMGSG